MKILVRVALSVVLLALLAGFIHAAQPESAASEEGTVHHADVRRVGVVASPASPPDVVALAALEEDARQVGAYVTAVQRQEVADYIVAVQAAEYAAAQARLAAYLDAIRPPPPPVQTTRPNPTNLAPQGQVQGVCGGATNGADQFIMRESGGNPNALNPSGAWGCYQIMPGTWHGAGCDELGAYGSADASTQAACASRLGLSAWNL